MVVRELKLLENFMPSPLFTADKLGGTIKGLFCAELHLCVSDFPASNESEISFPFPTPPLPALKTPPFQVCKPHPQDTLEHHPHAAWFPCTSHGALQDVDREKMLLDDRVWLKVSALGTQSIKGTLRGCGR